MQYSRLSIDQNGSGRAGVDSPANRDLHVELRSAALIVIS